MSKRPQDTSAEEPDGGNPHIRFRGGPRQGDRPGLLNIYSIIGSGSEKTTVARILVLYTP